ncbi:RnfH family protein [Shigella flexneri]
MRAREVYSAGKIAVEVAYALPQKQYLQRVTLDEGATVEQAIQASGLLTLRDDIDPTKKKSAFIAVRQSFHDVVRGDRVRSTAL